MNTQEAFQLLALASARDGRTVDIEVATRANAIVLPVEAIQDRTRPRPWVLVASDGRAQRVDVLLGLSGEGRVEVLDGLSEGQQVLMGPDSVEPGSRIRPFTKEL